MGETRVDLLHLLEDLRDAYPASLEETILTEAVANALDSGATCIEIEADRAAGTLSVLDDGRGMSRAELRRYHDLATSSKRRGRGIGFAGVGIKLGLLVSDEVVTETRRGKTHVATSWRLSSRHRAPWKWTEPPGRVAERGTAVRLTLANSLSELLDAAFVETALRAHFEPLLDPDFDDVLSTAYAEGIRFVVNGDVLEQATSATARDAAGADSADRAHLAVRIGRKRKPSAVGWLERSADELPSDGRGIAVATLGKVIKRGWDWLGLTPQAAARVRGLIEAPGLAESLALNKADFLRTGPRGATYLAYRKAIQQVVSEQLGAWGDEPVEPRRRLRTRPVERDLGNVLVDLADDFPLLAALVERRTGGQRRLPLGDPAAGEGWAPAAALVADREDAEDGPSSTDEPSSAEPGAVDEPAATSPDEASTAALTGAPTRRKRPTRYNLEIRLESRPEDPQLARLIESVVWVNDAHPAYERAVRARSEGYHLALATAMALAPLAVEAQRVHEFITLFLERWGEGGGGGGGRD